MAGFLDEQGLRHLVTKISTTFVPNDKLHERLGLSGTSDNPILLYELKSGDYIINKDSYVKLTPNSTPSAVTSTDITLTLQRNYYGDLYTQSYVIEGFFNVIYNNGYKITPTDHLNEHKFDLTKGSDPCVTTNTYLSDFKLNGTPISNGSVYAPTNSGTNGQILSSQGTGLAPKWINIPEGFSGDYEDLTNKPPLFSGDYGDLTNKPTLFSGNYEDLDNKPDIPTMPDISDRATIEYVNTSINNLKDTLLGEGAHQDLDTIAELSKALGDNKDIISTITQSITNKVDKTTTINGKTLSDSITLSASDLDSYTKSEVDTTISNLSTVKTITSYIDWTLYNNSTIKDGVYIAKGGGTIYYGHQGYTSSSSYKLTLPTNSIIIIYSTGAWNISGGFGGISFTVITLTQLYSGSTGVYNSSCNRFPLPVKYTDSGGSTNGFVPKIIDANGTMVWQAPEYFTKTETNTKISTAIANLGTFGTAASKNVVTEIDSTEDLPTSNAVKTFVEGKGYLTTNAVTSVNGQTGPVKLDIPTGAAANKNVDTSIATSSSSTNLPTSQAVAAFVEGKKYVTESGTVAKATTADSATQATKDGNGKTIASTYATKTELNTVAESIPSIAGLATETFVATKISELVDSAPDTLNTLGELATAIKNHQDVTTAINEAIANKANKADTLSGYGITDAKISNGTITLGGSSIKPLTSFTETDPTVPSHVKSITTSDIANWNNKLASFTETDPTVPTHVKNITSADITKWNNKLSSFTETDPTVPAWAKEENKPTYTWTEITGKPTFATVATSGSYNDLSNKPTIPTSYVSSVNGSTGAITNIMTTGGSNVVKADFFNNIRQRGWWDSNNPNNQLEVPFRFAYSTTVGSTVIKTGYTSATNSSGVVTVTFPTTSNAQAFYDANYTVIVMPTKHTTTSSSNYNYGWSVYSKTKTGFSIKYGNSTSDIKYAWIAIGRGA